jgi:hypothetical protein
MICQRQNDDRLTPNDDFRFAENERKIFAKAKIIN